MELRWCSTCKKEVSRCLFEVNKNGDLLKTCNPCREKNKLYKATHQRRPYLRKPKPHKPPKWGTKAYWAEHPEIHTRTCTRCGKIRPETKEYFYYIQREGRFQVMCKNCADMRKREYERRKAKPRRQSPEAKEKGKEYRRKYYEEHKEELNRKGRERYKKYYLEHHEEILRRRRELFKQNKDEIKERRREYIQTPKGRELKRINRQKWKHGRRSREKDLEASFTTKQWEDCKSFFNGRCAYCRKVTDLTMDHFIPVVSGGEFSRDNIVPACHSCNSNKGAHDFFVWYPAQTFYSKAQEERITKYLNYKGQLQQRTLLG